MSKPTKKQITRLRDCGGDSEAFHAEYDNILEEKLWELDMEWILAMKKIYEDSGNNKWYS